MAKTNVRWSIRTILIFIIGSYLKVRMVFNENIVYVLQGSTDQQVGQELQFWSLHVHLHDDSWGTGIGTG